MNKYKLIAALIIALTIMLCLAAGVVISRLLYLLPSPWNYIANGLFALAMLTWARIFGLINLKKKKMEKINGIIIEGRVYECLPEIRELSCDGCSLHGVKA